MRNKLLQIRQAVKKNTKSRYGFLLSAVALIEVIMILVVSTFAWVETISSIKISNTLGNIKTYVYTNAEVGTGTGYSGQPINLSDYFLASGNIHLSSASSANGEDFYFPQVANANASSNLYRKGSINDKNTNYISFSFRVQAKGTSANFYFDKVPTFKIGDTVVDDNTVRLAVSSYDEETNTKDATRVYSYNALDSEYVVGDVDGSSVATTKIYAFEDYDNKNDSEENILFSVDKDKSKIVTLTLWLQDPEKTSDFAGKSVTSDDFKIVTSVKYTTINFIDRTSAHNSADATKPTWNWVGNDSANLWICTASGEVFKMNKVKNSDPDSADAPKWTVTVPTDSLGDTNGDFYFYRTDDVVTSPLPNSYWNFWKTKLSQAGTATVPTYTAYGNTKPGSSEGYGTWDDVAEIKVLGDDAEDILKTPADGENPQALTLQTDNGTSVPMNWNRNFWRAYIPNDSDSKNLKLTFSNGSQNYSIDAVNRDLTENASTFRVTSATTGYWEPPAIIKAVVPQEYASMGKVEVSGGPVGATTVKVTKGTTVKFTAAPVSDGYVFEGWYSDPDCTKLVQKTSEFSFTPPEKDKTYTYYAKFQYNVRLTAKTDGVEGDSAGGQVQINDDGTPGAKVSLPVLKGGSVKLIALPNTEDYEFMGWYDTNNELVYDSTQTTVSITNLQKPINLFAVYNVKKFVLEAYASTDAIKENDKGGTVKFDSQTSSGAYARVKVAFTGEATFMAFVNDIDGYEFAGWYSDEACTNLVTKELTYKADKNTKYKTMYAKFVLKKYDAQADVITNFDENNKSGGTVQISADGVTTPAGSSASTKVTHGTSARFTANANDGYSFAGWYSSASGGELLSENEVYTADGVAGDIKVYAMFKQVFTVSLASKTDGEISGVGGSVKAGSGAEGAMSSVSVNYGDSVIVTATPADISYSFIKWTDAEGTSFGAEQEITLSNVKNDISLYAEFVKKTFTIEAYAVSEGNQGGDGGSVSFGTEAESSAYVSVVVDYNGTAIFSAFVNADDGYEFKGWHEKADCSDPAISTNTQYTLENITENKTLYAEFRLKRYTVTAVAVKDNGKDAGTVAEIRDGAEVQSGSTINISDVAHNSTVTLLAKPERGATFDGWYDAETGGNRLDDPASESLTITVTDNMAVYARFTASDDIYTTIYFAERSGFSSYYAYVYDNDTGTELAKNWPGTMLDKDAVTGYYKYTFSTTYNGKFRVIVNNGSGGEGNQYPLDEGLEGEYGKTYLFSGTEMTEYNPVSITLNAVSVNASGVAQSNGFTGGSITVDGKSYTSANTFAVNKGASFSATATASGNYEFAGWYDNAECVGEPVSTSSTLSFTAEEEKVFYAKFAEQEPKNIVYLKPNAEWLADNPRFAIYVFGGNGEAWAGMTDLGNGYYSAQIPDGNWNGIIFCRMNPNTTDNNWDNKWNQTVDLGIPSDSNNCFTIKNKDYDKYNGSWGAYPN